LADKYSPLFLFFFTISFFSPSFLIAEVVSIISYGIVHCVLFLACNRIFLPLML
jgi:hypothetical protein